MQTEDFILLRDHIWKLRYLHMKECRDSSNYRSHELYNIWRQILDRCYNPNNPSFPIYGARGISVCDRWLKLENFINDIGYRPLSYLTLDRIDPNKNYEPSNCRWTTKKVQAQNRREDAKVKIAQKLNWIMRHSHVSSPNYVSCLGGYR